MCEVSLESGAGRPPALLIWDAEKSPPAGGWQVLLWRSFGEPSFPDAVSIPQLVEENADILRKRYLSWIHDIGEMIVDGRRLVDQLQLRPGFSYWWMTLFAEKCNYSKSPCIEEAIRLMALEDWAKERSFSIVELVTAKADLAECVGYWCERSHTSFVWRRTASEQEHLPWRTRLYRSLLHPLQAVSWLCLHLIRRWPLKGIGLPQWRATRGATTFVSYLFNLVPKAAEDGRYESRYWAGLPEDLRRDGCETNWLHLYLEDELIPNSRRAADLVRKFNITGQGSQNHVTLDSFLTPRLVLQALRDWFRILAMGRRLKQVPFPPPGGTMMDLGPLFRVDWCRSFSGQDALANLLYCNLLKSAFKSLPRQDVGVYLQENQAWEFALIDAWKASGHKCLIGAPHTAIRYWDLRYFFDPRSYVRTGANVLPLPDRMALNGPAMKDACLRGGYPEERLVELEALRYLHLARDEGASKPAFFPEQGVLRILVLGEYLPENTQRQMRLLERAAKFLPPGTVYIVKPHPACPILAEDCPGLKLEITMAALPLLLSRCDVAYTNNVTSAAVDAYCAGVPVVSILDAGKLNLSPLRGKQGVSFVSQPEDLAIALLSAGSAPRQQAIPHNFFTLDSALPRWRKLLTGAPDSQAGMNVTYSGLQ
jgi:surface carbohydrate biosynthesis protein (TIGR04326 family)